MGDFKAKKYSFAQCFLIYYLLEHIHRAEAISLFPLPTSAGGVGKTIVEMQTTSTFLDASWDFVDETENGVEDIWWILEGQDYPRLWWELIPEN